METAVDFSKALGTEFKEFRDVEHEGRPARAVRGSRYFSTDAEDLWQALTQSERLARWFPVNGDLQLGGRFQVENNASGTILQCDRPEALTVTWEFGGNVSWVSVKVVPEKDGARLTLVHTMLQDEASEEHWQTYGPGATGVGWDLAFVGLGLHIDSGGDTVDQVASFEWMGSDAGKSFIRASAEAWGQAHISGGESPDVAQAMAERTASFYTGE
jgi:uncharacterized protein YndB with AHSA1/START domain